MAQHEEEGLVINGTGAKWCQVAYVSVGRDGAGVSVLVVKGARLPVVKAREERDHLARLAQPHLVANNTCEHQHPTQHVTQRARLNSGSVDRRRVMLANAITTQLTVSRPFGKNEIKRH